MKRNTTLDKNVHNIKLLLISNWRCKCKRIGANHVHVVYAYFSVLCSICKAGSLLQNVLKFVFFFFFLSLEWRTY